MPIKQKIKVATQGCLLFGSSLCGFLCSYMAIWLKLGLPGDRVGCFVCVLLAVLSCIGTFAWIVRG